VTIGNGKDVAAAYSKVVNISVRNHAEGNPLAVRMIFEE
jgi:hypothetical protein